MQPLQWDYSPSGLRTPALVCAFKGWNDAGDAASSALTFFGESLGASRFASIDPEEFYDFQNTRPQVKISDSDLRTIEWPNVEVFEAKVPRAPRDLILMVGSEPSYRWRTFTNVVTDLADAMGVSLVVTLGALLADVPHTRAISVTGFSSDSATSDRLGLARSNYEGPTGIVGVLQHACHRAGVPSASLWAAVPHYIAATPNPKAALALVRKLEAMVEITVDASDLEGAVTDYEHQVDAAVQSDPEVEAFVERLEQASDEGEEPDWELPSGDAIEQDLQRFLRQRGEDPPT
ncbi:MAG: PAC2 family protein [Solirubrobacterales bacterium]|nr:PAC2 family protein [Solirubrobacterales bacterium]